MNVPLRLRRAADADLMQAIADANADAFEVFYDRHCRAVMALCLRMLGDRAEAEEVVEEVFFEIWNRRSRYDPTRARPIVYLMTLSRSRTLDRLRARTRREALRAQPRDSASVEEVSIDTADATPLGDVLAAERRERVSKALAQLDPPQRTAVELSFLYGLTHSEIAERLRTPLGTVKTRIRLGLLRLREALREARREWS